MKRLLTSLVGIGCLAHCGRPPEPVAVAGSYELTVVAPGATSDGLRARLDLERDAGVLGAVLTFEDRQLTAVPVSVAGSTLTLQVGSGVHVAAGAGEAEDVWTSITIALDDGGVPRTATLAGTANGWSADAPTRKDIHGTATIVRDATAPTFALVASSTGGKRLPWEPVTLVASEPVRASDVAALANVTVGGPSLPLGPSSSVPTHAGESTVFTTAFGLLPAGTGTVTLGAIPDRTQNASKAATLPFEVLDVGAAAAAFDFDGAESSQLGTWGTVAHASGADCRTGGCVQLGKWTSLSCGGAAGPGLARRLSGPVGSITFAVRAKLESPYASTFTLGLPANALVVDVATDTGVTTSFVARTSVGDDWRTVTVPAPGARAFAIRGAVAGSCGPEPQPSAWTVWIDDVTVQ